MNKTKHPLLAVSLSLCALMLIATSAFGAVAHNSEGDDQYTFGVAETFNVANGDPYSVVSSTVLDIDVGDASDYIGSTATITAGTNTSGSSVTVSVAWRNRTDIETDGRNFALAPDGRQHIRDGVGVGDPGIAIAWDAYNMASDVSDISGVEGVFVLEMDYDESELLWHNSPDPWPAERPGNTVEEGLD